MVNRRLNILVDRGVFDARPSDDDLSPFECQELIIENTFERVNTRKCVKTKVVER